MSNNIESNLIGIFDGAMKIWGRIVYGEMFILGMVFLLILSFQTISGVWNYNTTISEHNVDTSELIYSISTPTCKVLVDATGGFIAYSDYSNKSCNLDNSTIAEAVDAYGSIPAYSSNASKIVLFYVLFMFWVAYMVHGRAKDDDIIYNSSKIFNIFLMGWVVFSIALFPLTFRDYPSSQDIRVDGTTVSVSAAFLSNDGSEYFLVSPTFMARSRDSFNGAIPLNGPSY